MVVWWWGRSNDSLAALLGLLWDPCWRRRRAGQGAMAATLRLHVVVSNFPHYTLVGHGARAT